MPMGRLPIPEHFTRAYTRRRIGGHSYVDHRKRVIVDRHQIKPLDCEDAKARLRDAARRASPYSYLQNHPSKSLLFALAAGFIAGYFRLPKTLSINFAQQLLPFFVSRLFKSKCSSNTADK